ncbi:MAG: hypothetical protein PUE12_16960 [Oscillospiraceae bacterium]|nr:hypothetical protein [Oscillospiraceae bacterium]
MKGNKFLEKMNLIDTEFVEEASKTGVETYGINKEEKTEIKKSENIRYEEYRLKAKTVKSKRYARFASVAAVLFITGIGVVVAGIRFNQDNEHLSLAENSKTMFSSVVADISVTPATELPEKIAESTVSGSTAKQMVAETIVSRISLSETVSQTSAEVSANKAVGKNEHQTENNIHDSNEERIPESTSRQSVDERDLTALHTESENKAYETPDVTENEQTIVTSKKAVVNEPELTPESLTQLLNTLTYSEDICDGLPEYYYESGDEMVFYINLSSGWIWRTRRQNGAFYTEEALLTKSDVHYINGFIKQYGLNECSF